jgi:hypothetical protein
MDNFADPTFIIVNIGKFMPAMITMMAKIASLIGLWLVSTGLVDLWSVSNQEAQRYISGANQASLQGALSKLLFGGVMLSMGSEGEMVGLLVNSINGGDGYKIPNMMSYDGQSNDFSVQAEASMAAILGIMSGIGFYAMCKGWMTINDRFCGRGQVGLQTGFAWLLGGVLCWNFKWFTHALNNTLGFEVFGLWGAISG